MSVTREEYFAGGITPIENEVYENTYRVNSSGVVVRELEIDSGKYDGKTVEISMITDSHIRLRDDYISAFEKGVECASFSEQIVLCGDTVESVSEKGHVDVFRRTVWKKYPDAVCVLGNHELFYGDAAENRKYVESVWPHDPYYHSKVLKDKVMIVAMDNNIGSYHPNHASKLESDLLCARKNNICVLIFQHIALPGLNMETDDNKAIYDIISQNGDIIKAVFSGHNHVDKKMVICAFCRKADGKSYECEIPQYTLQANAEPDFSGNILFIKVK